MSERISTRTSSAMPSTRALALFAFLLATILGCWRAADIFSADTPDWQPASATEASLMGILEPVAGEGNIRLSVTGDAGTGRTVMVLLSSKAADAAPTIERLATSVAMIQPAAGDQLIVEQAAFAGGFPGQPSTEEWIELVLLGALSLVLAWLGFAPAAAPAVASGLAALPEPERAVSADVLPAARPKPQPASHPDQAADLARKDPAKAASVLRSWMRGEGDAA